MNDPVVQVLVAILPSVVVFLTAFYMIKQFMRERSAERMSGHLADVRKEDHKHVLPLRLQAYERITLFLERISPGALVLRIHKSHQSSGSLHADLVATVREEFDHKLFDT